MIAKAGSEHFQSGADNYAAYLETPEGRLRCNLAFAHLQDFLPLPQTRRPLLGLYGRIFELERELGSRSEFSAVARYIQVIARHSRALSSKEAGS